MDETLRSATRAGSERAQRVGVGLAWPQLALKEARHGRTWATHQPYQTSEATAVRPVASLSRPPRTCGAIAATDQAPRRQGSPAERSRASANCRCRAPLLAVGSLKPSVKGACLCVRGRGCGSRYHGWPKSWETGRAHRNRCAPRRRECSPQLARERRRHAAARRARPGTRRQYVLYGTAGAS